MQQNKHLPNMKGPEEEKHLVRVYKELFDVECPGGKWHKQYAPGEGFYAQLHPLPDDELLGHLRGDYWIACRNVSGSTGWLTIDIDDHPRSTADRTASVAERLERVLRAFAPARALVCSSPSESSLHVYVPLAERFLLTELHNGKGTAGPVVTALRAVGLSPKKGVIEVYPTESQAFRLPFGRKQRIVAVGTDPVAVPEDVVSQLRFVRDEFLPATPLTREWLSQFTEEKVRTERRRDPDRAVVAGREPCVGGEVHPDAIRLWEDGIPAPRTQDTKRLFLIGEILKAPAVFGLPEDASLHTIAEAVGEWILRKHNGHSQTVRDHPDRAWWVDDNLKKLNYIIEKRRGFDPVVLGPDAWHYINVVSQDVHNRGQRYHAELWAVAFVSHIYRIERGHPDLRDGDIIRVGLSAGYLQGFPGGAGKRYKEYCDRLKHAGLLRRCAPYSVEERRAAEYEVKIAPEPPHARHGNVRAAAQRLAEESDVHRTVFIHALGVSEQFSPSELRERYSLGALKTIQTCAEQLRRAMGEGPEDGNAHPPAAA